MTSIPSGWTPSKLTEFASAPNTIPRGRVNGDSPSRVGQATVFQWPAWAKRARIAGAYFHPSQERSEIVAALDTLAIERVSVVLADSPLGEQYRAWVDDSVFAETSRTIGLVVELAHTRGLKVVLYHTGLELISEPERNPGLEHPMWAQRALGGTPNLYNDVSNQEVHWLNTGLWSIWLHPNLCDHKPSSYSHLFFNRIRSLVRTGIDGLWVDQVYLQSSVGAHHELWPSSDPCSAAAFRNATGLDLPLRPDWEDESFRRWVVWRHEQIAAFLHREVTVAREINPKIVFFNENSCADTGRSTYVATDPTFFLGVPEISTGHEIETLGDRMDFGETGMRTATLDDWLSFRTMVAFARAADREKPSWILTYGHSARDSAQLAGLTLAEGANFYETRGPQMADSVGSDFRTALFGWVEAHESDLYDSKSAAEVGLLYSPRNRDLLDQVAGEPYDVEESVHFAAYRAAANTLFRAHVPVDVVLDTDVAQFNRYRILVAPNLALLRNDIADALLAFAGTLVTIGDTGSYDEWLKPRRRAVQEFARHVHYPSVTAALASACNTALLVTTAPASVQIGLRKRSDGYRLIVVNTADTATPSFTLTMRAIPCALPTMVTLSVFGAMTRVLAFVHDRAVSTVRIEVPSGIDTFALLSVRCERQSADTKH